MTVKRSANLKVAWLLPTRRTNNHYARQPYRDAFKPLSQRLNVPAMSAKAAGDEPLRPGIVRRHEHGMGDAEFDQIAQQHKSGEVGNACSLLLALQWRSYGRA